MQNLVPADSARSPIRTVTLTLGAVLLAVQPADLSAQGAADSVTIVAGTEYGRGFLHRLAFGATNRRPWTTPVRVPVLDLSPAGLRTIGLDSMGGVVGLRLEGPGGQFLFRPVARTIATGLPGEMAATLLPEIARDQVSNLFPAAALVMPTLLAASGANSTIQPRAVVLPAAGLPEPLRDRFAGALGLIRGASSATRSATIGTDSLRRVLAMNPAQQVASEAYLLERLLDVFVGEWDRGPEHWQWSPSTRDGATTWSPVADPRDHAFSRLDGKALGVAGEAAAMRVSFGPRYPDITKATWTGRHLDRELLSALPHAVWQERAGALQAALGDDVLASAVSHLPPEWQAVEGTALLKALRSRRDRLPEMAERYYRLLALDIDVWATDADEVATASTDAAGLTTITIAERATPERPWYRRSFDLDTTREVRVYLRGGDDIVRATGSRAGDVRVRFIGGAGDDEFEIDGRSEVRLYDDRGSNRAVGGSIDPRTYGARPDPDDPLALTHRDWGGPHRQGPVVNTGAGAGLMVGWQSRQVTYGFRHQPFAWTFNWRAVAALGARTGELEVDARHFAENTTRFLGGRFLATGVERPFWYGLGNESPYDESREADYYRVDTHRARLELDLGWNPSPEVEFRFGPRAAIAYTDVEHGPNRFRRIAIDAPSGLGTYAEAGIGAAFRLDTRDVPGNSRRGILLDLEVTGYPAVLDVERAYGRASALVLSQFAWEGPLRPVLALLAGGTAAFGAPGEVPFHALTYLGTTSTLRAYAPWRFAGEQAAHGSAELRVEVARVHPLVPARLGLFSFWDIGRVWADARPSDNWHQDVGGGIWLGTITRTAVASLAYASGDEGHRIIARSGFWF